MIKCEHNRVKQIAGRGVTEGAGVGSGVVALWCRHCGAYRLNHDGARWVSPLASRLVAQLGDRVVRRHVRPRNDRQLELIEGGKGGNDAK
jgi:NMD protein affecting ribosome stability and mRNA decay